MNRHFEGTTLPMQTFREVIIMHIIAAGAAALALMLTCSGAPALAMPGSQGGSAPHASDPVARFNEMDTDHDGNLTWEELSAARPNLNRNAFDTIDTDHNGSICVNEWKAFSAGHGGAVSMPDMESMMKAMKGAGGAPRMEGGMPLIMPPSGAEPSGKAAPATGASHAMPLITPPSEGK